jgi:GT2 family glycosyltransferase
MVSKPRSLVERFTLKENIMTIIKGAIDALESGIISGWVVTENEHQVEVFCDDLKLGNLDRLLHRQDIIDIGYTEGNSGFHFDASKVLNGASGESLITLKLDNSVIAEKPVYIPKGNSLLKNSFFELTSDREIHNAAFRVSHRIGLSLDSYIAPAALAHSNGRYTRISFGDAHNTRELFEVEFELDDNELGTEIEFPLELAFVAKTSVPCNAHFRLISEAGQCLVDEPIAIYKDWNLANIPLSIEHSNAIRLGSCKVVLRIKHHGRRHIDIAMCAISESAEKFKTPVQQDKEVAEELNSLPEGNLLKNGDLNSWKRGVDFSQLKRGQELADNWFIEFNTANLGRINVAVATDSNQEDPLSTTIKTKFGMRFRASELDGYARTLIPFVSKNLMAVKYKISLDIEATTINKKAVLPRIYIIARDAHNDTVISDVARKVSVHGRQKIEYSLSAQEVNHILSNIGNKPVLVLAFDLAAHSDITIYSADMSVDKSDSPLIVENHESHTPEFDFEDKSITGQLHLLKGLDSWSTGESVNALPIKSIAGSSNSVMSTDEFDVCVNRLVAHKMSRPSRDFPMIDIIVPVYNACDDVLLCLSSLVEKTDLLHRVIVINDGQETRTADMLRAFERSFNHIEVQTNPENIGYTKSVNKGIKASNANWVVVLNSDTIVSEGWLGKLMNCALTEEQVGMVGPLSNAASWQSVPEIQDKSGDWHLNPLPEALSIDDFSSLVESHSVRDYPSVGVINGFCQLINMELLDEIGLLDEIAFPIGYGEENDMCARAVKAGYKLLLADDTYVFHAKSKSFGHAQRKKLAKQGSDSLKKKHPDVNWGEVTKLIRENAALNTLREQLSAELQKFESEIK